jgi:hypothetical protein
MESILVAAVLAVVGLVAAIGIYWGVSDPVTRKYKPWGGWFLGRPMRQARPPDAPDRDA